MVDLEWENRVRGAAFDFLRGLQQANPDVLPAKPLQQGFHVDGHRIALLGSGPGINLASSRAVEDSRNSATPASGYPPMTIHFPAGRGPMHRGNTCVP